jgi:hypothetical protein
MDTNGIALKQCNKRAVGLSKVINPDRGIEQNH